MIARTSRDPLATRAPAERDLVNARPRLSNSSYQFKSICQMCGAPRFLTRQRSRSWARVRHSGCHARNGTGGAGGGGSQACTRSSPAPRPQPLRRLRRRKRSVRRTWARCGASSWGAEGDGTTLHAGKLHGRIHARYRRVLRAVRGCSAEPHSSPTLIVQECPNGSGTLQVLIGRNL